MKKLKKILIPWKTLIRSKAEWLIREGDTQIYDETYNKKHFIFGFKIFERDFDVKHDVTKIDKYKKTPGF